ncbi:MAG TPA: HDOD domain-containing protein [Steroidobacteraceae bacterium]|nr:HDOD domain-containing protein [Steroidobacteraceae bacterium]
MGNRSTQGTAETIPIARQPIFDLEGQLYGYELLYRGGRNGQDLDSGDAVTARVIAGALAGIGLDTLAAGRPAFINVPRGLLLDDALRALPPRKVILEILEDIEADTETLDRVRDLAADGYRFAVDDCIDLRAGGFLELAEIVKVDVLNMSMDDLRHQLQHWRRPGVLMLAEKVETHEQHAELYAMGFDLFQGYYFARPQVTETASIAPNRLAVMQLLARMNEPDAVIANLADSIRTDVALSLGVLRWANSAASGVKTRVDSIDRAIVVLGLEQVRNLVSLLALARLGTSPAELMTMLLLRARLCELLAKAARRRNVAAYFTVGLLSGLDAVMGRSLAEVLSQLPLAVEVRQAIEHREGDLGAALAAVETIEASEFERYRYDDVTLEQASLLYLEAVQWTSAINVIVPPAGSRRSRSAAT